MHWLSFFIGVLVGWIIEWLIDIFYWRRKCRSCQEEKEALQIRLDEAERRIRAFQVKGPEEELAAEAAGGSVAAGLGTRGAEVPTVAPQRPDELKRLEGIGPKISDLLKDNGILTFRQLANTSVDRLEAILQAAGPNYRLADPTTWPEQARLAADDAWDELQALQDRLIGGREDR